MMYIDIEENDAIKTHQFHVGEANRYKRENVVEVQADGDELQHIIMTMEGLPYSKKQSVQIWTGDFAKFIVNNW